MIRRVLVGAILLGTLVVPSSAWAQKDPVADSMPAPPAEGGSSGDPLYGYLAFAALAGLFVFNLCRSSRRS